MSSVNSELAVGPPASRLKKKARVAGGRGDVTRAWVPSTSSFAGADVFNVQGTTATMEEIVTAIEAEVPAAHGAITFGGPQLQLPQDFDDSALQGVIGQVPRTPLREAIRQTRAIFSARRAERGPVHG